MTNDTRLHGYRKDHVPELDGLRGLAVLLVLWVHLPAASLGPQILSLQQTIVPGNLGVDLFFVLSGFLITRILLVDRGRGVPVRYFLFRRFLRIFPIYYLTIVLLLPRLRPIEAIAATTYTSNYASILLDNPSPLEHSWSLAVEEHFYLFWPPIVAFLRPRTSYRVLVFGVIPLALATILGALLFGPWKEYTTELHEFVLRSSTARFLSLGLGALLAYHEIRVRSSKRLASGVVLVAAALGALLTIRGLEAVGLMPFLESLPATKDVPGSFMWPLRVIGFPCISLAIIVAAVAWSGSKAPLAWIFRIAVLGWIGRISYGLYLYHFPIFRAQGIWGVDFRAPDPLRTAAVLALCFGVATASYWVIERPLLELGARFRGTPGARAEAATKDASSQGTPHRTTRARPASLPPRTLRLAAAGALIAVLAMIFNGGDAKIVAGFASRLGSFYELESTTARAELKYAGVTRNLGAQVQRWRRTRDAQATAGTGPDELLDALASVRICVFASGIMRPEWDAPRTGCFYDAATGLVHLDATLLEELSKIRDRATAPAVAYEVCSAFAAWVQASGQSSQLDAAPDGSGQAVDHLDSKRLGLERDAIAGRIAALYYSGHQAAKQLEYDVVERALEIAQVRHGQRAFHLGSWSYPGRLEHAPLRSRARWFFAGLTESSVDHAAAIRAASPADL